jgi:hypothetical protein
MSTPLTAEILNDALAKILTEKTTEIVDQVTSYVDKRVDTLIKEALRKQIVHPDTSGKSIMSSDLTEFYTPATVRLKFD